MQPQPDESKPGRRLKQSENVTEREKIRNQKEQNKRRPTKNPKENKKSENKELQEDFLFPLLPPNKAILSLSSSELSLFCRKERENLSVHNERTPESKGEPQKPQLVNTGQRNSFPRPHGARGPTCQAGENPPNEREPPFSQPTGQGHPIPAASRGAQSNLPSRRDVSVNGENLRTPTCPFSHNQTTLSHSLTGPAVLPGNQVRVRVSKHKTHLLWQHHVQAARVNTSQTTTSPRKSHIQGY